MRSNTGFSPHSRGANGRHFLAVLGPLLLVASFHMRMQGLGGRWLNKCAALYGCLIFSETVMFCAAIITLPWRSLCKA